MSIERSPDIPVSERLDRILLSAAEVGLRDAGAVADAVASGWLSPVGPALDRFEEELAAVTGRRFAVGLSSGTGALHLGLLALGVRPGDEVWVPTLTFVATANAVRHAGGRPTFFDVAPQTWTLDLDLVRTEIEGRLSRNEELPRAIIPVDLYGRCADLTSIGELLAEQDIRVLTDAAESLGATILGKPAGSSGAAAALSFNGNKIITTSGGGALVTDDEAVAANVRYLATQARQPVRHYEHEDVGFNYRLSNILAALGSSQLSELDTRVDRRRAIHARYVAELAELPGFSVADPLRPEDIEGESSPSRWLTCILLDPIEAAVDRDGLIDALEGQNIETRPVWKPMHLQPVYRDVRFIGMSGVAQQAFEQGVALPAGSALTEADIDRVIAAIRSVLT